MCLCSLPFFFTASLYLVRALWHAVSNHGAKCFAHLFGFFAVRFCDTFTTPASVASRSRNSSILLERSSFCFPYLFATASNAALNAGVDVCAFHLVALLPYSLRHSPSTHLYDSLLTYEFFFVADVVFLGWPTLSSAVGLAESSFVDAFSICGCPLCWCACASVVIGITICSRSWSVILYACKFVCLTCGNY